MDCRRPRRIALTLFVLTPIFYHLPNAVLAAIVMVAVAGLDGFALPHHPLETGPD